MNDFIKVYQEYAKFSGRSRRKEFWMFHLFYYLILIFLYMVIAAITAKSNIPVAEIFFYVFSIGSVIPSIAVTVRRLHDVGQSGWMMFINVIPIVGTIVFLVFMLMDSHTGHNRYGENPKQPIRHEPSAEVTSIS